MHFDSHMRGARKSKVESIVVTSTVGIDLCVPERVSLAREDVDGMRTLRAFKVLVSSRKRSLKWKGNDWCR